MVTNEQLISDLKQVASRLSKNYVSTNEYRKHGKHDVKVFYKRFGSWIKANELAGLVNDNDLTNKRFGRLTAIKIVGHDSAGYFNWLCRCDCGKEIAVASSSLKRGLTQSCGCLQSEMRHKPWGESTEKYKELTVDGVREPDFNKKKLKNNTSGYTGVYKKKNRWVAELIVKGVRYREFGFTTPEDAYKARLKMEAEYLPEEIFNKKYKK